MRMRSLLVAISFLPVLASAQTVEVPSFIKPYPGAATYGDPSMKDFDEIDFPIAKVSQDPPHASFKRVQGKVTKLVYENPEGRSLLEIYKNYEDALKAAGFKIVFTCAAQTCGSARVDTWHPAANTIRADGRLFTSKLDRAGQGTVWVSVFVTSSPVNVHGIYIAQEKAMETGLVSVTIDALKEALESDGHVAVGGILFDTGKATLKPESAKSLGVVRDLLQKNPSLLLYVVGHTDDEGDTSANVTLSNSRANAVVQELTSKYGIAPARLKSAGVGPYVPVATNKNEEGRSQNRRVELVQRSK
jgi:OmpA-OmpF porin, OOP family